MSASAAASGTAGAAFPYQEKHGVRAYLRDIFTLIGENAPSQPVQFVSEYLHSLHDSTAMTRAFRHVRLATHDHASFSDNVAAAYALLDASAGEGVEGDGHATDTAGGAGAPAAEVGVSPRQLAELFSDLDPGGADS